ncbi:MAG: HigA family addiction module antidote protein [Thermoanaerobaculia bacterium]|nr:HigA family addiction module antidote protein [Thermoanaerobaculia bacterium]
MPEEILVTRRPERPPVHPGELLRDVVMPALRLSVSEAARQLRISRQSLHRLLVCKHGITPEMAVRLGKFCGNGPGLWLRMQQSYDLWHVERKLREEAGKIPTHSLPDLVPARA